MRQPWTCARCDRPILKASALHDSNRPGAVAPPRRRLGMVAGARLRIVEATAGVRISTELLSVTGTLYS